MMMATKDKKAKDTMAEDNKAKEGPRSKRRMILDAAIDNFGEVGFEQVRYVAIGVSLGADRSAHGLGVLVPGSGSSGDRAGLWFRQVVHRPCSSHQPGPVPAAGRPRVRAHRKS